jgi:hypothetical protein
MDMHLGRRGMPLEDYLIPGEEVKFRSGRKTLRYGGKHYEIVITDRRLVLYARRGLVFQNDDVVTEKLVDLQGIKYRETGVVVQTAMVEVRGKTLIQLTGKPAATKALYQQLMQFL